jgi:hypothetical protein
MGGVERKKGPLLCEEEVCTPFRILGIDAVNRRLTSEPVEDSVWIWTIVEQYSIGASRIPERGCIDHRGLTTVDISIEMNTTTGKSHPFSCKISVIDAVPCCHAVKAHSSNSRMG